MKKIYIYSAISGILLGISMNTISGIPLSPLAWFCLVPFILALKSVNNFRQVYSGGFYILFFVSAGFHVLIYTWLFYRRSFAYSYWSVAACCPVFLSLFFSKQTWLAKSNFSTSIIASVLGMVFL